MLFPSIKRYCYCNLILILFSITAFTQSNIYGRVLDERDNAPLPGASVYFNYTSVSTKTNNQGDFQFEGVRILGTELVIYVPGYELLVFRPTTTELQGKKFVFKLKVKEHPPESKITIDEELRKKCLNIFKENFLGITEEATKCIILNGATIYFTRGGSPTSLSAFADTSLVIINNMLGYKIYFNLVEFWYDSRTAQNYFFGYARYESLGATKKWKKNRQKCYYGSTLHFYRSLITHQLYREGFGTFLIRPLKDTGKGGLPAGAAILPALKSMMAVPVADHEILHIDSVNNFSIRKAGTLLVQYNKEPATKNFLYGRVFFAGYLPKGVESFINFKAPLIGITLAGVLNDASDVAYSGYWIYERIANVLPYDYDPG